VQQRRGRGLYGRQSGEEGNTRLGGTPRGVGSDEMSPLYENRCGLVYRLNIDGEERRRRAQVGPVGDKIGSLCPPRRPRRARGELHLSLTRAHAAQGGITLGPEQGEFGASFCYLGKVEADVS
jgi:hypothetical protein